MTNIVDTIPSAPGSEPAQLKRLTAIQLDSCLNSILRAAGSGICYYTMPSTLAALRKAMRDVESTLATVNGVKLEDS